jgi:hypothetical protein
VPNYTFYILITSLVYQCYKLLFFTGIFNAYYIWLIALNLDLNETSLTISNNEIEKQQNRFKIEPIPQIRNIYFESFVESQMDIYVDNIIKHVDTIIFIFKIRNLQSQKIVSTLKFST